MKIKIVSVRTLREQIKHLLDRVVAGDQVVITRRGKPIARLTRAAAEAEDRYPLRGSLKSISPDFDRPLDSLWGALKK
jgi:prevent-host-death family protein